MGWSTWCTDDPFCAFDTCNEKEVREIADALVSEGLRDLGYTTILLDDCWSAETRNASTNELMPVAKTFPSGIPALVDYLGDRGIDLGLYTDVGKTTCRKGRPGSFGHYQLDAETLVGWGVKYVKIDNCDRPAGWTEQQLYANFSAAFNATGTPVYLGACEWGDSHPETWAGDYVQGYRVACDHLPFWEFPPEAAGDVCYGQGVKGMLENMAFLHPEKYVKPYAWMDADFLMTTYDPTMSHSDSRTEFSMWAMWSAPLITATDVRHMSHERKAILSNTEVLAIHKDPLWQAAHLVANTTHGQIWARPLHNGDLAVALINTHDFLPRVMAFDFAQVGWHHSSASLRDLWDHKDLGVHSSRYASSVGPHDIHLLRLSPNQNQHQL